MSKIILIYFWQLFALSKKHFSEVRNQLLSFQGKKWNDVFWKVSLLEEVLNAFVAFFLESIEICKNDSSWKSKGYLKSALSFEKKLEDLTKIIQNVFIFFFKAAKNCCYINCITPFKLASPLTQVSWHFESKDAHSSTNRQIVWNMYG